MKKLIILLVIILLTTDTLVISKDSCDNIKYTIAYQSNMLDRAFPPLSIYMPYEVMTAYLTFFDIEKKIERNTFQVFVEKQIYLADTIQSLLSKYYILQDYNPLLYNKYNISELISQDTTFLYNPLDFKNDLISAVQNKSINPNLDKALIATDYINHIKIDSFEILPNYNNTYKVTTTIKENIKGKLIPDTEDMILPKSEDFSLCNLIDAEKNKAIVFEVKNFNEFSKYNEFIFFSEIQNICIDTSENHQQLYFNIYQTDLNTMIFPISNGIVIDPDNSFNFGYNLTVEEWKYKLKHRINQMINQKIPTSTIEKNNQNSNRLSIYPNPARDYIEINLGKYNGASSIAPDIKIYDIYGSTVTCYGVNNTSNYKIDVSHLPTGMYFVRVGDEVMRFVKM